MKTQTKTSTLLVFFLLLLSFSFYPLSLIHAQAPQKFNYQAVARNGDVVLENTDILIRFQLLQGNPEGDVVWEETHNTSTNHLGFINLEVGSVAEILVDWNAGPYYLKVQLDLQDGNGFRDFGNAELLSVPYALNAKTVSLLDNLNIQGPADMNPDSALFEVKRNDGQIVFAVYNSGVRMFVEKETGKGSKGGFAIGGFTPGKGEIGEYFRVTTDSVRIYLDNSEDKRRKGGFAIGGFTPGKDNDIVQEYLRVTEDSTRVYIDNTATKGSKGGFAIGGFTPGKGSSTEFMNLSPENYFIGHESGTHNTTGYSNVFIGNSSGYSNTMGYRNVFLGHSSGYFNKGEGFGGSFNVLLGDRAGYNNDGSYNVFMGYEAGSENTTGMGNIFMGFKAGQKNITGGNNVIIGYGISHKPSSSWNLIIDNTGFAQPLIWGYFQSPRRVVIAGDSTSGSGQTFFVNGTAGGLFAWEEDSDERLKKDIRTIQNPLQKVEQLRGVEFTWRDTEKYNENTNIGFLAQETIKILPEVVNKNGEYYSMQYAPITALLVEAVKKQQDIIQAQEQRIVELETENEGFALMKKQIAELQKLLGITPQP